MFPEACKQKMLDPVADSIVPYGRDSRSAAPDLGMVYSDPKIVVINVRDHARNGRVHSNVQGVSTLL